MNPVPHKRGASFVATVAATVDGQPLDLSSVTVTSQVRRKGFDSSAVGELVTPNLVVQVEDSPAGLLVIEQLDTSMWPVGLLEWDIRIEDADGNTSASETVIINCVHEVTK